MEKLKMKFIKVKTLIMYMSIISGVFIYSCTDEKSQKQRQNDIDDTFYTIRIHGCDYIASIYDVNKHSLTLKGNGNCGCVQKETLE